jgi:predicted DNA-binding helix-hairpin-helix protein
MTDPIMKLNLMAEHVGYEVDEAPGCPLYEKPVTAAGNPHEITIDQLPPISYATVSGGRKIPILKTMLTSACENNCNYCACRSGRNFRRETFSPDELAKIFMLMYQKRYVQGIFLSSGVLGGAIRTQDELLKTAEILRYRYQYKDYLHLKVMPGAEYDQVLAGMKLADRISVNLEAPNAKRLYDLAPMKGFSNQLLDPLKWIQEIRANKSPSMTWNGRWPSSVTQFVVGGADETDVELLQISQYVIQKLGLSRTYYSAFSPVKDTPLENREPESMWRRYRLFQASFLLRDYPFGMEDMPFVGNGYLPLEIDPKKAWADENLLQQPIDLNAASMAELLHVPGIGPIGARRIFDVRRRDPIKTLGDLKRLGIHEKRAAAYIVINGKRPAFQPALLTV